MENDQFVEFLIGIIHIDSKDKFGRTPLHIAACKDNLDCLKLIISAGAEINSQSVSGETPLIKAIRFNKYSNTKILLRYGAESTIQFSVRIIINY